MCRNLVAFASPPVGACLSYLLTRVAVHYSFWGAVPLFVLAWLVAAFACLVLAVRFAGRQTGWQAVPSFIGWVACSAALTVAALALIDLLPISVGDGP